MKRSDMIPEECPACGSEAVEAPDNIDAVICNNCSVVVRSEGVTTIPEDGISESPGDDVVEKSSWQEKITVKDTSEAELVDIISQIEEVVENSSCSDEVAIQAAEIVVEAWRSNFMHGRKREPTIGAAVYAASRACNESVPPGMVADAVDTDKESLLQYYVAIKSNQNLALDPPRPEDYVNSICTELGLSEAIGEIAKEILEESPNSGGNPIGIATASVYSAAKDTNVELTLRESATEVGLTKETVWKHSNNLSKT